MALTCPLTDLTNHFPLPVDASGAAPQRGIRSIRLLVPTSDPTTSFAFGASTIEQFRGPGVEAILDVRYDHTLNDLRHPMRVVADVAEAETRHDHATILML